jgi:hypothetical protein
MTIAWFYNLQVGRLPAVVNHELEAMLSEAPLIVCGAEAVGYHLAQRHGYTLIRDRSREGRANLFAYLRDTPAYPLGKPRWTDQHQTWTRTQHPGRHAPRSLLHVRVGPLQLVVGHAPPRGTDNTVVAQQEYASAILNVMSRGTRQWARTRPRLALADWNRRPGELGPGPTWVASRLGGSVWGDTIDCAVSRHLEVKGSQLVSNVQGVPLGSDHRHAFVLRFALPPVQGG